MVDLPPSQAIYWMRYPTNYTFKMRPNPISHHFTGRCEAAAISQNLTIARPIALAALISLGRDSLTAKSQLRYTDRIGEPIRTSFGAEPPRQLRAACALAQRCARGLKLCSGFRKAAPRAHIYLADITLIHGNELRRSACSFAFARFVGLHALSLVP